MTHDFAPHASLADADTIVTAEEKNLLDPTWVRDQFDRAEWLTASSGGTNCVKVAFLDRGLVGLGDTLNPDKDPLLFAWTEWKDFLEGARAGRFDHTAAPTA
ncbi:DUF397 domain-containing protein [Kitasatospora sp. NBC_01300]|uniref:DUF397 domain-containing protein n=1 Tax=Kitasatospora sp. NBC_01300 TaxID=2903574 RepID=UPI002F90CEE4|nr:DUF397 domain-containing protein [Kitasatospora sp. NBC_01300]